MFRSFPAAPIAVCALLVAATTAQANLVVVPTIEVQSFAHSYRPPVSGRPGIATDFFLIGDGNYSGGEGFSVPSIANGDTFAIRIQAPAGQKFVIHEGADWFGFGFNWLAGSDSTNSVGGTISFENFAGAPLTEAYNFMGAGDAGKAVSAEMIYQVSGAFEFTAIDISVPVQSIPGSGPRHFGSVGSTATPSFYAIANGADQVAMSFEPIPVVVAAIPELGSFASVGAVVTTFSLLGGWRRRVAGGSG